MCQLDEASDIKLAVSYQSFNRKSEQFVLIQVFYGTFGAELSWLAAAGLLKESCQSLRGDTL